MLAFMLCGVTLAMICGGLAVICMVGTDSLGGMLPVHSVVDSPATEVLDPAETLSNFAADATLTGDWRELKVARLSEVEAILDALETHHVNDRQFRILQDNRYLIRWR